MGALFFFFYQKAKTKGITDTVITRKDTRSKKAAS